MRKLKPDVLLPVVLGLVKAQHPLSWARIHNGINYKVDFFGVFTRPYLWYVRFVGPELDKLECCYTTEWQCGFVNHQQEKQNAKAIPTTLRRLWTNGDWRTSKWEAAGCLAAFSDMQKEHTKNAKEPV